MVRECSSTRNCPLAIFPQITGAEGRHCTYWSRCLLTQRGKYRPFLKHLWPEHGRWAQTPTVSVFSAPSGFAPAFAVRFELLSACVTMFVHRFLTAVPPEYLLHFPPQSLSSAPQCPFVHFGCFSSICFLAGFFLASEFLLCSVEFYILLAGFLRSCFNFLPSFICSRPLCIHQYLKSRILKYFTTFQIVYHLWKNRDVVEWPHGFPFCFCVYSFTLLSAGVAVYSRCFPFLLLWVLFCVSFCSELSLLVIETMI